MIATIIDMGHSKDTILRCASVANPLAQEGITRSRCCCSYRPPALTKAVSWSSVRRLRLPRGSRGSLLAFPAWRPHEVTAITSGIRYVAAVRALRPSFR